MFFDELCWEVKIVLWLELKYEQIMNNFECFLCISFLITASQQADDIKLREWNEMESFQLWHIKWLYYGFQQNEYIFTASGTITCQIDSPDRDECLKQFMQDMLSQSVVRIIQMNPSNLSDNLKSFWQSQFIYLIQNGMKMFGIPAIDPYVIDSHTVTYKRGGNFSVTATMFDVKVHGASKAKIMDVK